MAVEIANVHHDPTIGLVLFEAIQEGQRFTCAITDDDLTGTPAATREEATQAFEQRWEEVLQATDDATAGARAQGI